MEQQLIQISKLEVNKGQIEGLPQNPRFIRDTRFEQLKKSIEDAPEMLNLRELIVMPHGKKYVVIGGNMRLRACTDLGYKELPCKVLPADTPPEKLREYAIKDNNGFGQDDWDLLVNEWDEVELGSWGVEFPIDFATSGDEQPGKTADDAEEDDFDEDKDKVESRCNTGDLWQLGDHRLLCGSSTEEDDVRLLMAGDMADLLLTDPPYNVNYGSRGKQYKERGGNECGDDDRTIMNDNMGDSEFLDFLKQFCKAADEVMNPGAAFYIFHSDTEGLNFRMAVKETGWPLRECLIWEKNSLVLGRQDYQWIHEPALYGWKPGAGHNWYSDRSQTTVLHFDRPTVSKEHPTMKPVKLFAYLMGNSSKEGDIVLDSFGGSGTTLIAAEQLGRKARLMELDPHYCDVIIARWEKLTGRKAEILTSKQ